MSFALSSVSYLDNNLEVDLENLIGNPIYLIVKALHNKRYERCQCYLIHIYALNSTTVPRRCPTRVNVFSASMFIKSWTLNVGEFLCYCGVEVGDYCADTQPSYSGIPTTSLRHQPISVKSLNFEKKIQIFVCSGGQHGRANSPIKQLEWTSRIRFIGIKIAPLTFVLHYKTSNFMKILSHLLS